MGDGGEEAGFEAIAECAEISEGPGGGGTEGDDAGDVFGAGATAGFVAAAVELGMQLDALADVEGTDAFGGVHFVAAEGVEIDSEGG